MVASRWHCYAFIIVLVAVIVGTATAARSPAAIAAWPDAHEAPAPSQSGATEHQLLYNDIDGYSKQSQPRERTNVRPLSVSTGPRVPSWPHVQPGRLVDNLQEAAPGDHHSQDGTEVQISSFTLPVVRSDVGSEQQRRSDSRLPEGHRQAYLLEDRVGRVSVVEERTRMLPGGGEMTWQRTTSPDGVTVTTVASSTGDSSSMQALLDNLPGSSSSSSSSSSLFDYVGHFSAVSTGMLNNALAPLDQLFNALDAQQQQLQGLFTSRFAHAAAAAADAAAAAGPQTAPQQSTAAAAQGQQQQQHVDEKVAQYAEQFAMQQEDELTRLSQEQQLHEILESSGLALTDSGTVITLDEAQKLTAAAAAPDEPEADDVYADQYIEPAEVSADFADTPYDIMDSVDAGISEAGYVIESEDSDLGLDAAALGDYSTQLAGLLNTLAESMPDAELSDWVDIDFLLLLLLAACTLGMCMLFLQSILQLRTVLVAGNNLAGVAILPIKVAKVAAPRPAAIAVAAGVKTGSSSHSGSEVDLRLPLLTDVDAESAVEQQQQQQGARVQRYYNPMHYQYLANQV